MITINSSTQAALESDNFEYAYLCDLPSNLHYTNHATDISYNSNSYLSNGLLMNFSDITKDQNMKVGSYTLTLSNVSTTISNAYMTTSFRGQEAVIYLAILSNNVIVGDPIILFKGTLDTWNVSESKSNANLRLKLTSHWASYNQKAGNYTNDTLHQQIHSGDEFFKYAHQDKENIGWGK